MTVSGVTINCPMLELCKIVFSWTNSFWRYMDMLETYLVDMGTWAGRRSPSPVIILLYRAVSSILYIFWQSTINLVFSPDREMAGLVMRVQSSQVFELLGVKRKIIFFISLRKLPFHVQVRKKNIKWKVSLHINIHYHMHFNIYVYYLLHFIHWIRDKEKTTWTCTTGSAELSRTKLVSLRTIWRLSGNSYNPQQYKS